MNIKISPQMIEGLVTGLFNKNYDEPAPTPQFHRELWELACSDEKFVAVAAPRGHAKTTAGTQAYILASVLFRASRHVVIVSDTIKQASLFLANIKQELMNNASVIELFQIRTGATGVEFDKDTENEIIVRFRDGVGFRIVAKGAEQSLRGMTWNNIRPDLIVLDDVENEELVMNSERRDKFKRWVNGALVPAMSPRGKFRIWGTILHADSYLENLMPKDNGHGTVHEGLRTSSTHLIHKMWQSVKYKAHNDDFTEFLWSERFGEEWFRKLQASFQSDGMSDLYSQEYLNRPIDESVAFYKKKDLLHCDTPERLTYYVTCDLAISQAQRADFSVFLVFGVDENRRIHVVNVIRDRLDGREIVNTIIDLQRIYEPEVIGIEDMQVSQSIGPFLREEMMSSGVYPTIFPLKHMGKDKVQRSRSIQARVRAKTVFFDTKADWYNDLETELLSFPRSKKDDQADTFAYAGMLLDKVSAASSKEEDEDDEYEEEYRQNAALIGKSRTTGY